MTRIVLSLTATCATALVLAAAGSARSHAVPKLVGTVGPGFTISLKQNGKAVKTLKAGTYTFVIHDRASIHSFALTGPKGFAKTLTTVPFMGTKTMTLRLAKGAFKFYCPPHAAFMVGKFFVR